MKLVGRCEACGSLSLAQDEDGLVCMSCARRVWTTKDMTRPERVASPDPEWVAQVEEEDREYRRNELVPYSQRQKSVVRSPITKRPRLREVDPRSINLAGITERASSEDRARMALWLWLTYELRGTTIAKVVGCSPDTARRWINKYKKREEGVVA